MKLAILSLLLNGVISQITPMNPTDFTCFSTPKQIEFVNNPGVAVPDLESIRVMTGSYPSQRALNYAAFMFMRELLGINVTFYPTYDPDQGWSQQGDDPNVDDDKGYPENFFWWLSEDYVDVNFEYWPSQQQAGNGLAYILKGDVDAGGSVGAYGEESLFIPKYLVDSTPEAILPSFIKSDTAFRESLINGSSLGDIDYISKYDAAGWFSIYATNSRQFDTPDYTKPTIWGSLSGWSMTTYAKNLTTNILGGLDVNFALTGTEGSLVELVSDLYRQRLPFIANIYTVDNNFAIIDNITGEFQEFEKIAFPRNPDQSPYGACALLAQCQYAVSPLYKAANPLLRERFPEVYDFFIGYGMSTSELNKLISKYLAVAGISSMSSSEKWLNASCEWLRDPSTLETWNVSSWLIDVERYDCLEGCGLQVQELDDGAYYGGSCDYYTGQCQCQYDELFTDTDCKESCPGLVGPYLNDSNLMTFDFCGGHGTCNTINRLCKCELGYGDEGCQTKYEEYEYLGLSVIIIILSSILSIIGIICIIWLRMNAHYKTIKALSVDLTSLMTLGLIFITSSNICLSVSVSSISCIAWQWLFGLGGILAIMSPLLKAYRVSRVFHGGKMLRAVRITDKMLMATLLKTAAVEIALCTGYSVCHEMFGGTTIYYNDEMLRTEEKCNDNPITNYLSMGSYAFFFIALCALTYYSWGTRRALSVFKESTCAYFSSFLSLLCTLITFVFYMATSDPAFRVAVQSFAIILVIIAVLILFYGTRIYAFFNQPENRNVTDQRAAHTQSTVSHSESRSSVMKPGPSSNA